MISKNFTPTRLKNLAGVSKPSKYEIRSFTKDGFFIIFIGINSCLIFLKTMKIKGFKISFQSIWEER
jgi:hypothetical protein